MTYVRLESKNGLEWIEYSSAKRKGFVKRKFSYSEGGSGRSGELEGSDTTVIGRHQANAESRMENHALSKK